MGEHGLRPETRAALPGGEAGDSNVKKEKVIDLSMFRQPEMA